MKEIKMKMRSEAPMLTAKVGYIVISVVFCTAGMFMIAAPQRSLSVIIDIFAAAMILFGVVRIVGYFSHDLYRLAFQYDLQFGVLMIVLGITAAIRSERHLHSGGRTFQDSDRHRRAEIRDRIVVADSGSRGGCRHGGYAAHPQTHREPGHHDRIAGHFAVGGGRA